MIDNPQTSRLPKITEGIFGILWLFVMGVSVWDGYLVLTNRVFIALDERNPIGQALITLNRGDVWLLLAAKLVGTVIACAAMLVVYWRCERRGLAVATGIACFQLGLLIYLCLR